MRLPEDAIKKGILHPEQLVRDAAARYFAASSLNADPTVMPLVVQAIQAYGWEDAFEYYSSFADLAQTEDTFLWCMDELQKVGRPRPEPEGNHCLRLSSVIARADVGLLLRHKAQVMELSGLFEELREVVEERLHLLTLDTATCWRELEDFCEAGKDKRYSSEVKYTHACRLVESLGRDERCADRVLALLAQKIEDFTHHPMKWLEPVAVRLAGELRLEAAVPLIVAKFHEDADILADEAIRALSRIGGTAVVEAIAKDWPTAPWHFRLYATSALGKLRSDLVVVRCAEFYGQEMDSQIKEDLLHAILSNVSSEGVEPARQWCLRGNLELRRDLLAVATLTGLSFPELPQWLAEENACC